MLHRSLAVVVIAFGLIAPAVAQKNTKLADKLFHEGRRLMRAGKLAAACEKFAESYRAEASVGALLNLGDCEEKRDDLTAAWLALRRAELMAKTIGDAERARFARTRMNEVGENLGFVTIELAEPWGDADGLTMVVDGRTLLPPEIGRPIPLGSGDHELRVTAEGARPLTQKLSAEAGTEKTLVIDLAPVGGDTTPGPYQGPGSDSSFERHEIAGMAMTATGAVGVLVGVSIALARSEWSDTSTGLTAGGLVLGGSGLVVWLLVEGDDKPTRDDGVALSPAVAPGFVGVAASGRF